MADDVDSKVVKMVESEEKDAAPAESASAMPSLLAQIRNPTIRLKKVDTIEKRVPYPWEQAAPKPHSDGVIRRESCGCRCRHLTQSARDRLERLDRLDQRQVEVFRAKESRAPNGPSNASQLPPPLLPPPSMTGDGCDKAFDDDDVRDLLADIRRLRDRQGSLSLSEASDWSDD